ncbi:MAG: sulfite exporter TauE/SafE family protein [Mycobacteriales bacterium]
MRRLIVLGLVGLIAQLIDGSLGMAYGVTSTTLLLAVGTTPASASAAVHLAEIGTTLVSGVAHWRFGNVDWHVVCHIALPGAIGAFAGATLLSSISTAAAAPWMAGLLLVLGLYLLLRFSVKPVAAYLQTHRPRRRWLIPLGTFAGFIDATGGGGWGPVATPALLAGGKLPPHRVIGSVDTSELVVAVGASAGFLLGLQLSAIPLDVVAALLIGGVLAAPLAAWLVRKIPARLLGAGVGGLIVVTNMRTLLHVLETQTPIQVIAYAVAITIWASAIAVGVRAVLREKSRQPTAEPAPVG